MRYVYSEASSSAESHHQVAKQAGIKTKGDDGQQPLSFTKSTLYIIGGLVGLVFGGEFIVDGATGIAKSFGMAPRVIGLLIIGPGTSFPELIASIVAARKKQIGMVIGNVLGSNMFNIFFTLGATALIHPIKLDLALNTAILVNIGATALVIGYVIVTKNKPLGRAIGAVLGIIYVSYMVYAVMT